MTFDEFDFCTAKLIQTFNEKHYPPVRLEIMYSKLKHVDKFQLLDACNYLIATSRQVPLLEEILEALNKVKKRDTSPAMHRSACTVCDCYGVVIRFDEKDQMFAWQCNACEAGYKNFSGIPKWSDHWARDNRFRVERKMYERC